MTGPTGADGADFTQSLAGQFLIAMPGMLDPSFEATVTLICEHNTEGALGVVVNRPTELSLGDVLKQLDMQPVSPRVAAEPVLAGGPVAREQGFVVHALPGDWEATIEVTADIRVSFSLDIVSALAQSDSAVRALFGLGYAGWAGGQLEREMLSNSWLTVPADASIVFDRPYTERWRAAAEVIGVDIASLGIHAGHD